MEWLMGVSVCLGVCLCDCLFVWEGVVFASPRCTSHFSSVELRDWDFVYVLMRLFLCGAVSLWREEPWCRSLCSIMSLRVVRALASTWLGNCNCIALVSMNVCSPLPPRVWMWQRWVAYLTSQGLSVQVVCVRPRLTCVIPWGISGVVAIKGTWSTSSSNEEFKAAYSLASYASRMVFFKSILYIWEYI